MYSSGYRGERERTPVFREYSRRITLFAILREYSRRITSSPLIISSVKMHGKIYLEFAILREDVFLDRAYT